VTRNYPRRQALAEIEVETIQTRPVTAGDTNGADGLREKVLEFDTPTTKARITGIRNKNNDSDDTVEYECTCCAETCQQDRDYGRIRAYCEDCEKDRFHEPVGE